jgi:hyperosmotically inducible protein
MRQFLSVVISAFVVAAIIAPAARAQDRTIGERVDDATITAAVKAKLAALKLKNLVNVDVDTRDGIVHLDGMVPSPDDKIEAERLARLTKGVRGVVNDLRVAAATDTSPSASPGR